MGTQDQLVYILGDGDHIRERIEALLLGGDLKALGLLSRKFSEAILLLAHELEQRMEADVVMSAGDDLLVRVPVHGYDRRILEELGELYRLKTGNSISFGVGSTIESAYLNLRRAKSSRKKKIFDASEPEVP